MADIMAKAATIKNEKQLKKSQQKLSGWIFLIYISEDLTVQDLNILMQWSDPEETYAKKHKCCVQVYKKIFSKLLRLTLLSKNYSGNQHKNII